MKHIIIFLILFTTQIAVGQNIYKEFSIKVENFIMIDDSSIITLRAYLIEDDYWLANPKLDRNYKIVFNKLQIKIYNDTGLFLGFLIKQYKNLYKFKETL